MIPALAGMTCCPLCTGVSHPRQRVMTGGKTSEIYTATTQKLKEICVTAVFFMYKYTQKCYSCRKMNIYLLSLRVNAERRVIMSQILEQAEKLLQALPKEQLGFFPTPFYRLDRLSEELGVNLYIKRDDFTGMNLFGGNKVRKLEYLLGEAKAKGCEYAITYGATQSNHAMETAAACRRCGIKPILYLTAVVEPDEADVRANLLLDKILDVELHIVDILPGETEDDAEARSFEMGAARAKELNESGHPCYDIPMGGASIVGSVGFANGYVEFEKQVKAMNLNVDYIFHATGTGGTMAGLAAGRKMTESNTKIISITVSPKDEKYLRKVEKLANDVLALVKSPAHVTMEEDLHMDTGYYAPGYEQPNEAASEAIRLLARTEGLFVDPVYTGKALAGLIDYVRSGKVPQGSNVVFWHTGGATALFAEHEILGKLY